MPKKCTINDIAKQLGVSTALVSFVLNGKSKEKRISDEMAKKVLKVAKNMNYTPNYLAKSLRQGKSNTLGLIVADISNLFFATLARYIEIEASKYGYRIILSNSDEEQSKFATQLDVLKNGQVDGFILCPPFGSEKELFKLKEENIPFVIVDRLFKDVVAHSIICNNYKASYKATERLIQNNRKRIALLNLNYELINMRQRAEGYFDALLDNGFEIDKSIVTHLRFCHEKEIIMEAIQEIVKNEADAILFTTGKLGGLGIECMRELGIRVPEDMSIITFDDEFAYRISYTPISAIVQPLEQISKEAVRILMNIIDGKYSDGQYENVELDVKFNYRQSCV